MPKLTLAGLAVTAPSANPVPVAGIVRVGLLALDVTVKDPECAPVLVGEKRALNVTLCPAASVMGALTPVSEKPDPVAEIAEIVRVVVPGLEIVSCRLLVVPV